MLLLAQYGLLLFRVNCGMLVIVFTVVITGLYVQRANNTYDALTKEILEDVTK